MSFIRDYALPFALAETLLERKSWADALIKYKQAIETIVGSSFEIPLYSAEGGGLRSEKYVKLDLSKRMVLMKCCNKVAECFIGLGQDPEVWPLAILSFLVADALLPLRQALDWLDEVTLLFHNMLFSNGTPLFGMLLSNLYYLPVSHTDELVRLG